MAHELETQNGVASFASFREPAWHGLGTVFTEEKTTKEMLDLANLSNWNVRLEDLETPTHLTRNISAKPIFSRRSKGKSAKMPQKNIKRCCCNMRR